MTSAATPVFRFAPSPNGELHLGHALSALVGYTCARQLGGRFLVRIEDIDVGRCRPEFIDGILEDLRWLGIDWDGPVIRQSEHFHQYRAAANRLREMGLLYPCFATRAEIAAAAAIRPGFLDPDGAPLYPGLHKGLCPLEIERRLKAGMAVAWRIDMARAVAEVRRRLGDTLLTVREWSPAGESWTTEAAPERWGDAVIVRKDVPTSYHLAVVVDDARQGVTHVTRGCDLYAATGLHRLLQVLLGLPAPAYHHHELILTDDGRKLAKSSGDTSLRQMRVAGLTTEEVRRRLGFPAFMARLR